MGFYLPCCCCWFLGRSSVNTIGEMEWNAEEFSEWIENPLYRIQPKVNKITLGLYQFLYFLSYFAFLVLWTGGRKIERVHRFPSYHFIEYVFPKMVLFIQNHARLSVNFVGVISQNFRKKIPINAIFILRCYENALLTYFYFIKYLQFRMAIFNLNIYILLEYGIAYISVLRFKNIMQLFFLKKENPIKIDESFRCETKIFNKSR